MTIRTNLIKKETKGKRKRIRRKRKSRKLWRSRRMISSSSRENLMK